MRIKKATLKDFDQIFPLLLQLWSTVKISQDEAFFVYGKLLRDKQVGLAVVEEDKKIIGFASYRWKWDLWTQGKVAHMDEIIIDQKYRGCGIGKKLAIYVEEKMKKIGCNIIICESALEREKTHSFYEKMGWKKYGYAFKKTR